MPTLQFSVDLATKAFIALLSIRSMRLANVGGLVRSIFSIRLRIVVPGGMPPLCPDLPNRSVSCCCATLQATRSWGKFTQRSDAAQPDGLLDVPRPHGVLVLEREVGERLHIAPGERHSGSSLAMHSRRALWKPGIVAVVKQLNRVGLASA